MRFLILSLIFPFVLASQQSTNNPQPTPQPGRARATNGEDGCAIEGQILNSATGEPIKKASLILRRSDVTPSQGNFPASYSTVTDAAGSFSMKDIDPGKYRLSVNRTGFVNGEYGARGPMRPGTTLSLEPKQHLQGIVFRLGPHALIVRSRVAADL